MYSFRCLSLHSFSYISIQILKKMAALPLVIENCRRNKVNGFLHNNPWELNIFYTLFFLYKFLFKMYSPPVILQLVSWKRVLLCPFFNEHYLSIPRYTGRLGNRFQETHGMICYRFLWTDATFLSNCNFIR